MRTTPAPTTSSPRRLASAVGLGLALSVAAPIVAAPVAGATTVEQVPAPGSGIDLGSKIYGGIRTGNLTMDLRNVATTGSTGESNPGTGLPHHIEANAGANAETRFFYASNWGQTAELSFDYAIDDGTYVLHGYVKVPNSGPNIISAEIRHNGMTTRDDRSPYTVIARWMKDDPYDPSPEFDVYTKDTVVVTDKGQQADILQKEKANGLSPLDFAITGNLERVTGPYHQVSKSESNTLKDTTALEVEWETTTTIQDSLGGKIKAEVELAKFLKASAEVHYEHTWESSESFKETATLKVRSGHRAAWFYADAWDRVHGDLTFATKDKVYVFKDTSVDFPSRFGDLRAQDLGPIDGGHGEG